MDDVIEKNGTDARAHFTRTITANTPAGARFKSGSPEPIPYIKSPSVLDPAGEYYAVRADTDPDEVNYAAQMAHTGRNRDTPKRSGKTPEAKVSADCVKWLELLDFYVLRTGAGMAQIDGRWIAVGRKGGHDYTCCAPNGRYVSMETKSENGKPSEAQLRQREFILRRNGIVTIPHSLDELKADMCRAFGEQTIRDWETLGKAREAQRRKTKNNTSKRT